METNALYFGDNLKVLSERMPDGTYRFPSDSVDLVYLDPPFNSNRNYNLIFKESSGDESEAQIQAFEDTWHWDSVARDTLAWITVDAVNEGRIPERVGRLMDALVRGIGHNDMSAYLVMMAPRLVELHRVLKPTGSLYLHCDPTASHHLKVVLDAIFGAQHFVNEITWKRSDAHNDYGQGAKHLGRIHDVILFYRKLERATFNPLYTPLPQTTIDKWYRHVEPETGRRFNLADITGPGGASKGNPHYEFLGVTRYWRYSQDRMQRMYDEGRIVQSRPGAVPAQKRYLDESKGVALQDIWTDIDMLRGLRKGERLGWMTQKPVALLERIIALSSNPGDIVLDPFCGCGTALIAAEKLKRRWIGIDITHLSIAVMKARLFDSFGLEDVPVYGVPADLESARMLAAESTDGRYEFQWWAVEQIAAHPVAGERKKGRDRGIDGVITFTERDSIQRILVSVKSGRPALGHVKELLATLTTEGGAIGVLIELDDPTSEMRRAAVEAGQYESELWGGQYDRLQILTVEELLDGKKPNVPKYLPGYQQAARVAAEQGEQQSLGWGG